MFRKVLFPLYLGIFDPFSACSQRNHAFYSCNVKRVHTFEEYILSVNLVQSTYCLVAKQDLSLLRPPQTLCSLTGSSVHGISQARILECVAISFSRWSSQPRDWTCLSCLARQIFYYWATWQVPPNKYRQQICGAEKWKVSQKMMCKYNVICQVIIIAMKKSKLDIKESSRRYF